MTNTPKNLALALTSLADLLSTLRTITPPPYAVGSVEVKTQNIVFHAYEQLHALQEQLLNAPVD